MDYRLKEGASIIRQAGEIRLVAQLGNLLLPHTYPAVLEALLELGRGPVAADDLRERVFSAGSWPALAELYFCLETIARSQCLERTLVLGGRAAARMQPLAAALELGAPKVDREARYRLSRFVVMRCRPSGGLAVETPLAKSVLLAEAPGACRLLLGLAEGSDMPTLHALVPEAADEEVEQFLEALVGEGYAGPLGADGLLAEDRDPVLRQWEPHDLYFHSRSRLGRHANAIGGNFRFKGELPPQPARKAAPAGPVVPLFRPDLTWVTRTDPPLQAVLEARSSVRGHALPTLTAEELGAFLFRAARNRGYKLTEVGEFTSRPYPSGGASYELEIYLTIDACQGLERGVYYYDPDAHALVRLAGPSAEMAGLLHDAWRATAELCWPQVLLTLAARFQRVSWKYDGMAYATILKNVGVLYQTFYLVATAMNLAACGLGIGDSDRFCRLAGTDYLREGSVGEFALGRRGG